MPNVLAMLDAYSLHRGACLPYPAATAYWPVRNSPTYIGSQNEIALALVHRLNRERMKHA